MSTQPRKIAITSTKVDDQPAENQSSIAPKQSIQKNNNDLQLFLQGQTLPEVHDSTPNDDKHILEISTEKNSLGSMSQQPLSKNNSQRRLAKQSFNPLTKISESLPRNNNKLQEIALTHYQIQNQPAELQRAPPITKTTYNLKADFRNIKNFKNVQQNSLDISLSPLPDIYKEYLPHIIKNQISEQSDFKKQVQKKALNELQKKQKQDIYFGQRKGSMQQLSIDNIRQDISYLKEGSTISPFANQPTILTTGDKHKDEYIGFALNLKNIGQSLIDLPQSLQQLQALEQNYNKQFLEVEMQDGEEKLFDSYLQEHFNPSTLLKDTGLSLYDYADVTSQSKFLKKLQKNPNQSPNRMFQINEKNLGEVMKSDKLVKIDTKPDKLALLNTRLIKKHGKSAVWNAGTSRNKKKESILQESPKESVTKNLKEILFSTIEEANQIQIEPSHIKNQSDLPSHREQNINKTNQFLTQNLTQNHSQKSLGNPSSRQDALILISWIEKMITSIHTELKQEEQMFHLIQLVFNIAIQEVSRQTSVHCIERGAILKKIFNAYISLIDTIHRNHKVSRKNLKMHYAEKLDKYVTQKEDQIRICKEQIEEYKQNNEKLKNELDGYSFKLNQANLLSGKFKKKLFNTQLELQQVQKRNMLLEREKNELQIKVKDMADRLGEELSVIDEKDQIKIMEAIESEFENEQIIKESEDKDAALISDQRLIQEDDKQTEMPDFEEYLKQLYGEKTAEMETQTEKILKRHIKVGVNISKLGITTVQETQVDAQMLGLTENEVNIRAEEGAQEDQQKEIAVQEINDNQDELNLDDEANDSQDLSDDSIEYDSVERPRSGDRLNMSIQIDKLEGEQDNLNIPKTERRRKKHRKMHSQSDLNKLKHKKRPQEPIDDNLQKKLAIVDAFVEQIKLKLQSVMQNDLLKQIGQSHPELFKQITSDINEVESDVLTFSKTVKNEYKQYNLQVKQGHQREKHFEKILSKTDMLEMDNYLLKEQIANVLDFTDGQKSQLDQVLIMLDNLGNGEVSVDDIKKHIGIIGEQLAGMRNNKALMQLIEDKTVWDGSVKDNKNNLSQGDGTPGRKQTPVQEIQQEIQQIFPNPDIQDNEAEDLYKEEPDMNQKMVELKGQAPQKKGRAPFKFYAFNLGKKKSPQKKGAHPSYALLKKVQSKNPKDLKDIMPRKMMLKIIAQIYQERPPFQKTDTQVLAPHTSLSNLSVQANQPTSNTSQNLLEWVYDNFMNKYGLKNVAEKKFVQLLSTCVLQKENMPRIRLFGRFMEVYSDLTTQDYNKYLEISDWFFQQVLNFKIDGDEEVVLIPLIERMKVYVDNDLQKTYLHLKGIREAVDFDAFNEFLIEANKQLQEEKVRMIKDFFLASDFDNDGLLTIAEFQLAMKVFHHKSSTESAKIFEEQGEIGIDEERPQLKLMTVGTFVQLSLDKDYFSPKQQLNFIISKNFETDFQKLQEIKEDVIKLLKRRVSEIQVKNAEKLMKMVQNLDQFIKDPYSQRIGLLRYRIVDGAIRRGCLHALIKQYMPVDLKLMGISTSADQLQSITSI